MPKSVLTPQQVKAGRVGAQQSLVTQAVEFRQRADAAFLDPTATRDQDFFRPLLPAIIRNELSAKATLKCLEADANGDVLSWHEGAQVVLDEDADLQRLIVDQIHAWPHLPPM